MAATAVGLFADANIAEAVVDALRAHGMPMKGIRIVSLPDLDPMPADGSQVPDAGKKLLRELRTMGASETESHAYLAGVREGNVLVFMTGSLQQADSASAIMNQYTPYDVEDGTADVSIAPAVHQGELRDVPEATPEREKPRMRQKGDGARLFSW